MTITRTAMTVRLVTADELPKFVQVLSEILVAMVEREASLGFIPPLAVNDAHAYWASLVPELRAGSRVLMGAFADGQIIGSGQLSFPRWPNAQHRAELQKLFVESAWQGHGVGRLLIAGLHASARERGRSLILLNARRPVAEGFYLPLGYSEIGVIPGYSIGAGGERVDSVSLYLELPS